MNINISQLLDIMIQREASDLHLIANFPPTIRVNGDLLSIIGADQLTNEDIKTLILPILAEGHKEQLTRFLDVDFGMDFKNVGRFRVNIYHQARTLAASFRLIPKKLREFEQTGLPASIGKITDLKQGLILVTGQT